MEQGQAASILYSQVKSQLRPEATLAEIEAQLQAVAVSANLAAGVIIEVMARFQQDHQAISEGATPRLLVNWGEPPRMGHQVRPEFSLICPGYNARPEVVVAVDRQLDHEALDLRPRVQEDAPGLWTFSVPFQMTSQGLDCCPGQYLIDVAVSFRDGPASRPRFYRCRIRLHVTGGGAGSEGGVLEIDSDGQSVVNLQGYNLKQFSRVILKGGQAGIINVAQPLGESATAAPALPHQPATAFAYQLRVDAEKEARLPRLAPRSRPRSKLEKAGLFFADGRRTIVLAKRKITFGRSRGNDVVLRFLPSDKANDDYSRNISRTHFTAELTAEGIELRDESRSGLEFNYAVVRERQVIPATYAGDVLPVELGVTGTVPKKFALEMTLFAPDHRFEQPHELEYWDELYCEIVGGRRSRLAREAVEVMLNAVRYDRAENLAGEESYVHLVREALIGGSRSQAAIVLHDGVPQPQARLLHMDESFWLEPLPGSQPISIDGVPADPRSLHPLSPGMQLVFDTESLRFDLPAQRYLD
ncbi:MAG: hypothetical protein U0939_22330 [Pirellulales bacterium]